MTSQAFSDGEVWTYTYNSDGMRTGRTNGSISYEYIYNGSQLMQMTRNGVVMNFTYINGIPATISFGGNTFYYVVNGQGDVTGITDSNGVIQVSYYYDAWGVSSSVYNPNSTHGLTLATINPLRYRGYVFDWEVGLYYLQSRYYIPDLGRFLNADAYICTNQSVLGNNLFGYCGNNPICNADPSGYGWISALVGAVVNVATTYVAAVVTKQEYTLADAGVAALAGAVNAINIYGPFISGAVSGIYTGYSCYKNGASLGQAIFCGTVSAVCTTASISNIARGLNQPADALGSILADATFGTGYNVISAATSKAVLDNTAGNATMNSAPTTSVLSVQNQNISALAVVMQTTSTSNTRIVDGKLVTISYRSSYYPDIYDNRVYCRVEF